MSNALRELDAAISILIAENSRLVAENQAFRAAASSPAPEIESPVIGSEVLCENCAKVFCPHGERLHFAHDGCPACDSEMQPQAATDHYSKTGDVIATVGPGVVGTVERDIHTADLIAWQEQDRVLQEIAALCDSDEHITGPRDVLREVQSTIERLRAAASSPAPDRPRLMAWFAAEIVALVRAVSPGLPPADKETK